MGKRLPQLYYIKMKNSYDLGFNCNRSHHGNVITPLRFLVIIMIIIKSIRYCFLPFYSITIFRKDFRWQPSAVNSHVLDGNLMLC